ncbi:MAG TPA: phosphate/phosphite/phosphonate ABC transporter substrate-binding protein [Planctomycetota bacterium]|nr:phosphate/phosphite/phosphonate ABC transporter substrate-binding protein [Planctomycetota bacterium]
MTKTRVLQSRRRVKVKRSLACVLVLFSVLVIPGWSAASDKMPEKVVFALKPDKNPEQMLKEKQALEAYLSAKLGTKVEAIIPLSSAVIIEGFTNGTIDLGYLSSTDLVKARTAKAADLLLAGEIDGKTWYQSYWLTLKDKNYSSVQDLKGKPIAFASKTSTSGFVIPFWDLVKQGLVKEGGKPEDFFGAGNVYFGTGYVSAVERVFNGDAEAAAVSDYVFNKDKHLTAEQRAKLKKMDDQGPVPTHVIAVRAALSPEVRGKLKAALLGLNDEPNQTLRDKLFTSKLVEVDADAHISTLSEALKVSGQIK